MVAPYSNMKYSILACILHQQLIYCTAVPTLRLQTDDNATGTATFLPRLHAILVGALQGLADELATQPLLLALQTCPCVKEPNYAAVSHCISSVSQPLQLWLCLECRQPGDGQSCRQRCSSSPTSSVCNETLIDMQSHCRSICRKVALREHACLHRSFHIQWPRAQEPTLIAADNA